MIGVSIEAGIGVVVPGILELLLTSEEEAERALILVLFTPVVAGIVDVVSDDGTWFVEEENGIAALVGMEPNPLKNTL
jgi:hypothetical protein